MKITKYITLLFSILSITGFAQTGVIKGTILTQDNQPARNVVVKLNEIQVKEVDSLGQYEFRDLEAESYQIKVQHISFASQTTTVQLKKGENRILDFILEEDKNSIQEVTVSAQKSTIEQQVSNSLRVQ